MWRQACPLCPQRSLDRVELRSPLYPQNHCCIHAMLKHNRGLPTIKGSLSLIGSADLRPWQWVLRPLCPLRPSTQSNRIALPDAWHERIDAFIPWGLGVKPKPWFWRNAGGHRGAQRRRSRMRSTGTKWRRGVAPSFTVESPPVRL